VGERRGGSQKRESPPKRKVMKGIFLKKVAFKHKRETQNSKEGEERGRGRNHASKDLHFLVDWGGEEGQVPGIISRNKTRRNNQAPETLNYRPKIKKATNMTRPVLHRA